MPQHNETLGSPDAPIKMLYFDDPQCSICREWHTQVMPALVRKYVRAGKLQNSGWLNPFLLNSIGASIAGFDVAKAIADARSPAITDELLADARQARRDGADGVPYIRFGRRRGPLKPLEFTEYKPIDFERPINRLLRKER